MAVAKSTAYLAGGQTIVRPMVFSAARGILAKPRITAQAFTLCDPEDH